MAKVAKACEVSFVRIKQLRLLNGYTQSDVAAILGVSQSTYCSKENNDFDFTATELKKLSILFEKSIDELVS